MRRGAPPRLAILASHPIQYFTPLYRMLAAQPGLDVDVMFYQDAGVRPRYDKQFGATIRWDTDLLSGYPHRFLRNVSPVRDSFNPLSAINPGAFVRLLRGYDALWLNGYVYPSNWLAAAAAVLRGTRLLLRCDLWLDPSRRRRRLDPIRDAVIRGWVRRSDALLYIGEANRQAYLAYCARPEQLFFTPYSVDVERIADVRRRYDGRRAELRRRWRVPPDAVVVLFVGKMTEGKHPEAVLPLARSADGARAVHLVFAGSGPLDARLRAEAAALGLTNVSFLGFVNQSALPEVYAMADIFVMPSARDMWGLVLNEAMAAGLAPVASDRVGAVADLVSHGETGFVFPAGDWNALEGIVRALAADDGVRARVGAAAAERSRAYNHGAAVKGILEALEAVGAYGRRSATVGVPGASGAAPGDPPSGRAVAR